MILTDLFVDIAEFRSFAPYVESNVTFEELNSSALSAKNRLSSSLVKLCMKKYVRGKMTK